MADDAKPRRAIGDISSFTLSLLALISFIATGALIIWTPLWSLCIPLWVLAPAIASLGFVQWLGERKRRSETSPRPSTRHAIFVSVVAFVVVLQTVLGGPKLWFRIGVELRLWQAGGLPRVESWVSNYTASLREEWSRRGGMEAIAKADDATRRKFFFRPPKEDQPSWLSPLTKYLPPQIKSGKDGPDGIDFVLSGWDHGWSLHVYSQPPNPPPTTWWVNRLSDRSFLTSSP